MTCALCASGASSLVPDATGLLTPLCVECKEMIYPHRPAAFPDGTHNGTQRNPVVDFADHVGAERDALSSELMLQTAKLEAVRDCLRTLVNAWRKEMRGGFATPEQQWALRRAVEVIGEE